MKIITMEEHCMSPAIMAKTREMPDSIPGVENAYGNGLPYTPLIPLGMDVGDIRLAAMDAAGIDMQILSSNPPGVQLLRAEDAVPMAKDENDRLANAVRAHPDRFAAFATLPMASPEAAAAELERAVNKLGMVGTMINGRTGGLFLDDPSFLPVLEAAAALDVPIYLHPGAPSIAIQNEYYRGFSGYIDPRFATTALGWHYETGVHALRMIFGGVFDRFPKLQIILGHWGETIPYFLDRINESMPTHATHLQRTVSEYFKNNVYVTPSGMLTVPPLMLCLEVLGADRIMYAMDSPYLKEDTAVSFLENAPISKADKDAIAHGNAQRLFKLQADH